MIYCSKFYTSSKAAIAVLIFSCLLPVVASAQEYYDDELSVYEEDIYTQDEITPDNDSGYYYKGAGTIYEPLDPDTPYKNAPTRPQQSSEQYYDDELSVYEEDIYTQEGINPDNDESYTILPWQSAEPEVYAPDVYEEDYIPYEGDLDAGYQAPTNTVGDSDQIRTYYDTEISVDEEYSPSQDFYPDYFDY